MPEITAVHFAIFALLFTAGAALGWIMRGDRSARERIAVNAGWQERLEAQEKDHLRLAEQNSSLMQAVSQYQAGEKDAARRARELSEALKDSVARRDELQRQVKDVRSDLESALRQREKVQSDLRCREANSDTSLHTLREKDNKIFRLSRELTSWHNRLPPLVAKFRERDREAKELETRLRDAGQKIAELEQQRLIEQSRVEPGEPGMLTNGLDASNDQYEETSDIDLSDLQDQIIDLDLFPTREPAAGSYDTSLTAGLDGEKLRHESAPNQLCSSNGQDDLKLIKGVGPAIERALHDLGIYSFDQIARISEIDINRIAGRLKGFRSRIYREDWIGQARTLHDLRQIGPV